MTVKILTVDDSRAVRMIVKKAFKGYDCKILEAGNGGDALDIAARELPDLIILDITMADISGMEVLERLKQEDATRGIHVMMLTAEKSSRFMVQAVKLGIKDYLHKPFKPEQLIESAGRVLELVPKS